MTRIITHKPTTPRPRWRTWAFRGILATFLLALLLVGANYSWKYWQSRPLLAVQRQCLTYTRSPTDVVFESDPAAARALAALHPDEYQLLAGPRRDFAMATPACWTQFLSYSEPRTWTSEATIFLHERANSGHATDQRRLVRVALHPIPLSWIQAGGEFPLDHVAGESWEPATFSSPAIRRSWKRETLQWTWVPPPGSSIYVTRIYAGQPDPADDSHFTFDYVAYGQRDTVDGWLQANDTVTLKPRHPPTPPLKPI